MSKTLFDYESYNPIETTVVEAKSSLYTDTTCWKELTILCQILNECVEHKEKADNAAERMNIWGPPSRYSSSYSDNQYEKYKSEYNKEYMAYFETLLLLGNNVTAIKDDIAKLNTDSIIGWEVNHSFRCKTKGGYATIGNYRYVIDKDFEHILIEEDLDSENSKTQRYIIEEYIMNDE